MTEQTKEQDQDFDNLMKEVDDSPTGEDNSASSEKSIGAAELPKGQTVTDASKGSVDTHADSASEVVRQDKPLDSANEIPLYDANEGMFQRDGGPYLDQVDRVRDEKIRAAREGREPNLDNPPVSVGTPLVHPRVLVEKDVQHNHGIPWGVEQNTKPLETVKVEDFVSVALVEDQESDSALSFHDAGPRDVETGPFGPGTPVVSDDRPAKIQESKGIEKKQAKAKIQESKGISPSSKPVA